MQRRYRNIIRQLLDDPATSDWLRAALVELEKRDPIDAATDAAILAHMADLRMTHQHGIARSVCVAIKTRADPSTRAPLIIDAPTGISAA